LSKQGVFAKATAFPVVSSDIPHPSRIQSKTGFFGSMFRSNFLNQLNTNIRIEVQLKDDIC
jgi:hypothetical protein